MKGNLILNDLPEWQWLPESLMAQEYELHGITAKVIHPKQLLYEKETYEAIGRPFRPKDAESKKVLAKLLRDFT